MPGHLAQESSKADLTQPHIAQGFCLQLLITTDFLTLTRTLIFFSRLKTKQNPTLTKPYQELIRPERQYRKQTNKTPNNPETLNTRETETEHTALSNELHAADEIVNDPS